MPGDRILVPVSDSSTVRRTVHQAVDRALDHGTPESPATVVFAYVHSPETEERPDRTEQAEQLLERVRVWSREEAESNPDALQVETIQLGGDEYVFSPTDVADVLGTAVTEWEIDLLLLDPEYDPGIGAPLLRPLEHELTKVLDVPVAEASVGPTVRRTPLVGRTTALQFGSVFAVSFLFYQVLAGQLYWFDLLTGVVTAGVVAVALTQVSLHRDPHLVETPKRIARGLLYVPYLLKEIVKANVEIAAVILHPKLPVEPRLTRIKPAVFGATPVTLFANSVTLTPGTLSVRVDGRTMIVHTLVPAAREDLFDGGLERAVRYVFYGPNALPVDPPGDRGDAEIVGFDGSTTDDSDSDHSSGTDARSDGEHGAGESVEFADDGTTLDYDESDDSDTSSRAGEDSSDDSDTSSKAGEDTTEGGEER